MTDVITTLIPSFLAFACGIFIVLSLVEKPVWQLMWNPQAEQVPDDTARVIHAALKRVIHLLPPTMMTTMSSVLLLLVAQTWLANFSSPTLTVLIVFIGTMVGIVARLKKRIDDVDSVLSDGEIGTVRQGLGALARLHHQGLLAVTITLIMQYALVVFG